MLDLSAITPIDHHEMTALETLLETMPPCPFCGKPSSTTFLIHREPLDSGVTAQVKCHHCDTLGPTGEGVTTYGACVEAKKGWRLLYSEP